MPSPEVSGVIGTGLIGYGMAGRVFHPPLIRAVAGLQLRSIVQRTGNDAREHHPDVDIARNAEAILADDGIELVVVATPTSSHFELARRALTAGKHVVVDKPFTVTPAEAEALIALARDRDRVLTVFQNRRWDADFLTIQRLLRDGRIGAIAGFESRFDRFRNRPRPGAWRESPEPGAGLLFDLGSHLIDQALVLFGLPERITADVRRERSFGSADDAFDLWLHYAHFTAILRAGMLVRERMPRFVVRGTEATFVKFGFDRQEAALAAGAEAGGAEWGSEPREQWGTLLSDGDEETIASERGNYLAFYENVRDAIGARAPLVVRAEQALDTIRIIELALESSRNATSVRMSPRGLPPSSDRSRI